MGLTGDRLQKMLHEVTPAYDVPGKIMEINYQFDDEYGTPKTSADIKRVDKFAEAPPDAALGRVAFGPQRTPPVYEPNNKVERALILALDSHFAGQDMLDKKNADLIMGIMGMGLYPSIFAPPSVTTIYRGMTVKKAWLAKALGVSLRDLGPKGSMGAKGKTGVNFKFIPKRGATSWSKSRRVATNFHLLESDRAHITMYADAAENEGSLLDANSFYKKIDGFDRYSNEKEVLGLAPIQVSVIEWVIED
jgi:hypothetical protein